MRNLRRTILGAAALSALALPLTSLAADGQHHHGTHVAQASSGEPTALVEEMRKLDAVFREVVSGVAVADGARVHKALETMHGTMEKTQEALHKGEVKFKKNADRVKEFEQLDKEFHKDLEALALSAHHNDSAKMTAAAKKLLDGCVGCHAKFR